MLSGPISQRAPYRSSGSIIDGSVRLGCWTGPNRLNNNKQTTTTVTSVRAAETELPKLKEAATF